MIFYRFLCLVKEHKSVALFQVLYMEINGKYGMIMEFIVNVMSCLKLRVLSRNFNNMIYKSITIRAATARVSFHFAMMTFFTWFIFIIISACSIKFTAVSITSIKSNTWHQLSFSAHCNCGTMAFSKV